MYICKETYIDMYIDLYYFIGVCVFIHIDECTPIYSCVYVYRTCMNTYTHTYIYVCIYICMCVCMFINKHVH